MKSLQKRVFEYLNELCKELGTENVVTMDARNQLAKEMAEFVPQFRAKPATMWDVEKRMDQLEPHVKQWQVWKKAETNPTE